MKVPTPLVDSRTIQELGEAMVLGIAESCPSITEFGPTSVTKQLAGALAIALDIIKYLANTTVAKQQQNFYNKLGLTLREATYATCSVTFTLHAGLDHEVVIPKGSQVQTSSNPPIVYETTENLIIPTGSIFGTVTAQCTTIGSSGRVNAGTLTVRRSPLAYVQSSTNTTSTGGDDEETLEDGLTRLQGVLQTYYVGASASSLESLANQVTGVYRAKCWRQTNYYIPTDSDPSETVLILQAAEGAKNSLIENVSNYINDKILVGWPIDIRLIDEFAVNVSASVRYSGTLQNVTTEITTAFNQIFRDWEWQKPVTVSAIKSIILSAPSVISCMVELPNTDMVIGKFGLPVLGTLSITTWQ